MIEEIINLLTIKKKIKHNRISDNDFAQEMTEKFAEDYNTTVENVMNIQREKTCKPPA